MKILVIAVFSLLTLLAIEQWKTEKNCEMWEEKKIMGYSPALKMIKPKIIKICIDNKLKEQRD